MKLNADIIYQNLKNHLNVAISGPADSGLKLCRPEFYLDNAQVFLENHVYVCSADHLPAGPVIGNNVVLIALGNSENLSSFKDRCSIISVDDGASIFEVFNIVQKVFNKYETWDESINNILRQSVSLQELLNESREIIGNPMLLIGSSFNYLAITDAEYLNEKMNINFDSEIFDPALLTRFLSVHEMSTKVREPLLLNLENRNTLSVNIFDRDEYLGCLTVFEEFRPFHDSDAAVCAYFAGVLKQGIQGNPVFTSRRAILRNALYDIVNDVPVDYEHRRILSSDNHSRNFVCLKILPGRQSEHIPMSYIVSVMESKFPESVAFINDDNIVALVDARGACADDMKTNNALPLLLQGMDLSCGVSDEFTNLFEIKSYYLQADAALFHGLASNSSSGIFFFRDYMLYELLKNAPGQLPVELYFPRGLALLRQHDENSPLSYMETLRVYLNNNMSVTKTAAALFVHRSTLIERMERINDILKTDLSDPDNRLLINLLLKLHNPGSGK
ncbi:MAG: PucR family transcriptional regulator [Lachnospiraceae bacterium]|jgi:hypothetical protein